MNSIASLGELYDFNKKPSTQNTHGQASTFSRPSSVPDPVETPAPLDRVLEGALIWIPEDPHGTVRVVEARLLATRWVSHSDPGELGTVDVGVREEAGSGGVNWNGNDGTKSSFYWLNLGLSPVSNE